jgi:hypothetical protein
VPGPLPLVGAGIAFAYSRKLRTRILSKENWFWTIFLILALSPGFFLLMCDFYLFFLNVFAFNHWPWAWSSLAFQVSEG